MLGHIQRSPINALITGAALAELRRLMVQTK
jgi:hypothetical protein